MSIIYWQWQYHIAKFQWYFDPLVLAIAADACCLFILFNSIVYYAYICTVILWKQICHFSSCHLLRGNTYINSKLFVILILTVSGLQNRIANTIEFSYKIFHAQFPKIAFVHKISVYVHVSPPLRPAIATHKKRSCISQWNKCYKLLFSLYGTCYWYCLWMGMALVTKYVVITCQRRGRWCYISYSFYKRRHFNSKEKQGTSGVKVSGGTCN